MSKATGSNNVTTVTTNGEKAGTTTTVTTGGTTEVTDPTKKETSSRKTTTTSGGNEPTVPGSTPGSALAFNGAVGKRAFDRLEEYAGFYSDIVNLQTVLERATNQVVDFENPGESRIPVVLGLPVTVIPTSVEKDAVAEVLVEINPKNGGAMGDADARVTSLVPGERSYNVAKIVSDQKSASLGAVFSIINFGASSASAKDQQYLVQDYDTVSFFSRSGEKLSGASRFGWQFRPVFGESTVRPVKRDLLVGVSLSHADAHDLDVTITTRWRRFDKKTRTAGGYFGKASTYNRSVRIDPNRLRPQTSSVSYRPKGDGTVSVGIHGINFFDGVDLQVGERLLPAGSFQKISTTDVRLTATFDELVHGNLGYVSIFGSPHLLGREIILSDKDRAPLKRTFDEAREFLTESRADAIEVAPGIAEVTVTVPNDWRGLFAQETRVVLALGKTVYGLNPAELSIRLSKDGKSTLVSARMPLALIADRPQVTLSMPFTTFSDGSDARVDLPIRMTASGFEVDSIEPTGTVRHQDKTVSTVVTVKGRGLQGVEFYAAGGFNPQTFRDRLGVRLQTLTDKISRNDSDVVRLVEIPEAVFADTKTLILRKTLSAPLWLESREPIVFEQVVTVDAPKPKEEVTMEDIQPLEKGHVGPLWIEGKGFKRVKAVRWNGEELRFFGPQTVMVDGTKHERWFFDVPSEMTSSAGSRPFSLLLDDGSEIVVANVVMPKRN
ncbi:hypothetical protein EON79_10305 [bacterium]|nr:MAG: hypothetical protein EON79_10305 [bacterium]